MADDQISIGELSRQVRDVLSRFESLATRLESQFVRNDNFALYKQLIDTAILNLQVTVATLATKEQLTNLEDDVKKKADKKDLDETNKKVESISDDRKWIVRLILGFVALGILGAVFAASKAGGAG